MLSSSISILGPERNLNNFYMIVLKSTIHEDYLEEEKENKYAVLKQVLGTVVLLYSRLSVNSLPELLHCGVRRPTIVIWPRYC
jgi:hypothetical protein